MKSGLEWAVKDSLVSYVEGLDDGVAEALAPASRSENGFFFPWDTAGPDAPAAESDGVLQFRGTARFAGHWGALDVEIRDPRIEFAGGRGTLLVRERGGRESATSLPFAELQAGQQVDEADGSVRLELSASLTGQGRFLLGGQYAVGQPLSPLRITFPPRHV